MSLRIVAVLSIIVFACGLFDDKSEQEKGADKKASLAAQRESLAKLQSYVGQWRGVGQVRRGSRAGAWTEAADVAWQLREKSAALIASSPTAKFFKSMRFAPLMKANRFRMTGSTSLNPKDSVEYVGNLDDNGVLELAIEKPSEGLPDRIKVRLAAEGKRLVVLYERKAGSRFDRLAEVGFTRRGSGFGSGTTGIECVVTGGEGTIAVRFEGKTYFVCCSGCKEYFDDDPAKTMKEYRERKAEEKRTAAQR